MYCPQCKLEYREGFTQCSNCDVPLVDGAPPEHDGDPAPLDLVTVFEGGDPVMLAMVHSLLDEEQIPYVTAGEGLQDLFGAGRIGAGFNIAIGPAKIQVTADRAAEARTLLEQLEVDAADSEEAAEAAAREDAAEPAAEPAAKPDTAS